MKSTVQPLHIIFAALIALAFAACENDIAEKLDLPAHLGSTLKINEPMWELNPDAMRFKDAYKNYSETNRAITAHCLAADGTPKQMPETGYLGSIAGGRLSVEVSALEQACLLDIDLLAHDIFSEWKNVAVDAPAGTKGNNVVFMVYDGGTPIGMLNKEKYSTTSFHIALNSVLYVYVTDDCHITGSYGSGYKNMDSFYYTEEDLNLALKKGWNTVFRKQSYSQSGSEAVSVGLQNPIDCKWVIRNYVLNP